MLADNFNYAQNWMTFWNDALRNDYRGTGYIDGGRKQITHWLYTALATNMPYDRFVAQLVDPTPDSEGFSKEIVHVRRGECQPDAADASRAKYIAGVHGREPQVRHSPATIVSSTTSRSPWTPMDWPRRLFRTCALEMVRCDKPTGKKAALKFLYPELGVIDPKADKGARLKQLAEIIAGPHDGRLTRTIVNRNWQKFMGRGLVEPVDDMEKRSPGMRICWIGWRATWWTITTI